MVTLAEPPADSGPPLDEALSQDGVFRSVHVMDEPLKFVSA
jgi:hypothetical protein